MLENVRDILNDFRHAVIKDAKKNLRKKSASGNLANTLDSELEVFKSGNFRLGFQLGDYGEFVDKGVRGKKQGRWKTPYRFGSGTHKGSWGKFTNSLEKWIRVKGIKGRDQKTGRFISNKSLSFLIARSIYNKGLKPSLFFTKAFDKHYKKLNKDLVESFGLDVEEFLKYTLNNLK